ncbi:MAG TPA: glycoside hydrolase family 3 N-terminal domain-containing protein [Bacteroidales bacterium]|nr:glycoside hydrolase family 3 N-terminal domain-containing protein [Bacteroidales bacterium]HRX95948.1 glycoside hydrolase family 3 N-terminal domain-containing protein [Bacteroidales bacterium]
MKLIQQSFTASRNSIWKRSFIYTFFLVVVLLMACDQQPETTFGKPGDKFVETLLAKMTLEEKIGQLNLVASSDFVTGDFEETDIAKITKEAKAGGILNIRSVERIRTVQKAAVEETRLGIPVLFGLDVIHGYKTIFPIPLALSCSFDLGLIEETARVAAQESTADGLAWTYSPMVDISRDPRWGRVAEGAGEDTYLGSLIAKAYVRGYQGNDLQGHNTMMACVKHFAAYGAAEAGREYNTVDMSKLTLYEWYLPPFKAAIDEEVGSIMTSFNEISGVPSTSNHWLLTELLRNDWHFNGFVVTDYTSINELVNHGNARDDKNAAELAMKAGVDMDMQGRVFLNNLKVLVEEGQISEELVDQAVRRILEAKVKLGLFDDPYKYCDEERVKTDIMNENQLAVARESVAKSCVLLKNENKTLPISKNVKSITIIGPLGNSKKDMLGNWMAAGEPEKAVTLLEGIQKKVGSDVKVQWIEGCKVDDSDKSGFAEAVKLARQSDYVILALGEHGWMSGEAASRTDINLPGVQNELAEAVINTGKPTAVVLFNGRPLTITKLDEMAPAILETWFGGTQAGNGIADVLFGDYNPSGKLTLTFPRNLGQVPVYYNHKNTGRPLDPERPDFKYLSRYIDSPNDPLYPFGYGLSYTTFQYSDLTVNSEGEQVHISVSVANTGEDDGEEVVQLYVQDKVGTITRPVKELKGFKKLMIKKGESKTIDFTLTKDDLAFYHPDLSKSYEPGEFVFFVGGNSQDNLQNTIDLK